MAHVLAREDLHRAWNQVKANHGTPGVDGMTVEQFPDVVKSPHWVTVREQLEAGSRSPGLTGARSVPVTLLDALIVVRLQESVFHIIRGSGNSVDDGF